jgi:hypothetical protein
LRYLTLIFFCEEYIEVLRMQGEGSSKVVQ